MQVAPGGGGLDHRVNIPDTRRSLNHASQASWSTLSRRGLLTWRPPCQNGVWVCISAWHLGHWCWIVLRRLMQKGIKQQPATHLGGGRGCNGVMDLSNWFASNICFLYTASDTSCTANVLCLTPAALKRLTLRGRTGSRRATCPRRLCFWFPWGRPRHRTDTWWPLRFDWEGPLFPKERDGEEVFSGQM